MSTKDEYIQLISDAISQSNASEVGAWKNDPFESLLKQIPKHIIEKYGDSLPEDLIPSTSDDVRTVNADVRIQFSQILGGLYLDLAALLKLNRATCSDEYQLLSLQDVATINASFEFFLLTGILPFLEPGVGLPASARSSFIKSWKLYDGDKETCLEKLKFAAKVMVALLECNDALAVQFLPKFIHDIISVRFSLSQLKETQFDANFVEILRKCPPDLLMSSLMFLTQDRKPTKTPNWMKMSVGSELTKIMVSKGGLSLLLQYYQERAGDQWTDNLPLTRQVAWHVATVPKMFRHPMEYHERMSRQFFETLWSQKTIDKNLLTVFIGYAEELRTRFSRNLDVTVFDQILVFWELLNRRVADRTKMADERIPEFSPNHIRNIHLLAQIQNSADQKRLRGILTVLIACVEKVPYVKDILKPLLEVVGNAGYTFYHHVITPSHAVILERKTEERSSLIEEIGVNGDGVDKESEFKDELWLQGIEDADSGVIRRLEDIFYIVDNVLSQSQFRTIMEMMSLALDDFLKVSEKERDDDAARFVELGGANCFSAVHAHLVVDCCFERLTTMSTDAGFSPEECIQLIKMAENILNNSSAKFIRLAARKRAVDLFRMTETEEKEFEATRNTAKMALPMASSIFALTQGFPRFQELHMKVLEALANFTKAYDAFPSEDLELKNTVDETRKMLKTLKIDVNSVAAPPVQHRNERRRFSGGDVCHDLIEELNEEEPAIRGGTLMSISKVFRNKSYICQRLLEYGVFENVKELVDDEDSYVYLAAINCLCEMSLFDRRLFDDIVHFYEDIADQPDKSQNCVIRLSRMAEAVGRMFLVKGDFSVNYVDKMMKVFFKGIKEEEEILRASSCGCLGNVFKASRGRGLEKHMQQMFDALLKLIMYDRSTLVRRSAVDLLRQCLRACGTDVFEILREQLLDLHREVRKLNRSDRDETVRLHAGLCIEELDAALNQSNEEAERAHHRRIRF